MARAPFFLTALEPDGDVVPSAQATFRVRSTNALASVYAAESGGSPLSGSVASADAAGRITAWLERGAYTVTIGGGTLTSYSFPFDATPGADATVDAPWIAGAVLPIGSMQAYAGSGDPPGGTWLLCDGRAISRTTYAALFSAIGTTYGAGNGTTTFAIPNLTGRFPRASGTPASGRGAANSARGATGGDESVLLTAAQSGRPAARPSIEVVNQGGAPFGTFSQNGATAARASEQSGAGGTDYSLATTKAGSFSVGVGVSEIPAVNASADHANLPPFATVGGFIIRAL